MPLWVTSSPGVLLDSASVRDIKEVVLCAGSSSGRLNVSLSSALIDCQKLAQCKRLRCG